jgi:hypothetical protein
VTKHSWKVLGSGYACYWCKISAFLSFDSQSNPCVQWIDAKGLSHGTVRYEPLPECHNTAAIVEEIAVLQRQAEEILKKIADLTRLLDK